MSLFLSCLLDRKGRGQSFSLTLKMSKHLMNPLIVEYNVQMFTRFYYENSHLKWSNFSSVNILTFLRPSWTEMTQIWIANVFSFRFGIISGVRALYVLWSHLSVDFPCWALLSFSLAFRGLCHCSNMAVFPTTVWTNAHWSSFEKYTPET